MRKTYDLNKHPAYFPEAMASATRIGQMDALTMKPRIRSTRELSNQIAPGCANGYATALKQAYNAGYWAGTL